MTRLLGLRAAFCGRRRTTGELPAATRRTAEAVATLVAGLAALAVAAARVQHPDAARVPGDQFLSRQIAGRVTGLAPLSIPGCQLLVGETVDVDGRDPKFFGRDLRIVGENVDPRSLW